MSVPLFTGYVRCHERRIFIAVSDSGQQWHNRYRRLLRCVIRTAVSCDCASYSDAHSLHAGVPTFLNSVATSREPSCERLPLSHRLLNAVEPACLLFYFSCSKARLNLHVLFLSLN